MDLKEWPYKTTFCSYASVISPDEKDKQKAIASLSDLKSLIKVGDEDIAKNPDLLYISADLFMGGVANNNNDAVTVADAYELASQVPNKYLNLEHEEKQIVGALFSYGFREYTTERSFVENGKDLNEVVVAVGGYIWRSVFPQLSDFIVKASDPESEFYKVASLSWEVYFKEYDIMVGSKNVAEAEIISDPDLVKEMTPFLKQKGGTGYYEKKPIYRLVKGPKLMLGAGIVRNPAADVKGIFTSETEESEVAEASLNTGTKENSTNNELINKELEKEKSPINIATKSNKFSHSKRIIVKRNIKAMKIKNLDDYKKVLASLAESEEEVDVKSLIALDANFEKVVASYADEIRKEIVDASKAYEDQIKEKENAVLKAAEEKKEIEEKFNKLEAAKKDQEEELEKIKARLAEEESARLFNERMGAIDESFDLDDESRKVVASSIKTLKDEEYESWLGQFKILAKEKSKEYKKAEAEKKKAEEEKAKGEKKDDKGEKAKASDDDADKKAEAEKLLASAKAEETKVPNTPHKEKVSLKEEFEGLELELEK